MLTSVAVLIAGALVYFFELYWIDPLISIAIALYLVYTSGQLLWATLKVLMQFTPASVELAKVRQHLEQDAEVASVRELTAWQLADSDVQLSAHLTFKQDLSLTELSLRIEQLQAELAQQFAISHARISASVNTQVQP